MYYMCIILLKQRRTFIDVDVY